MTSSPTFVIHHVGRSRHGRKALLHGTDVVIVEAQTAGDKDEVAPICCFERPRAIALDRDSARITGNGRVAKRKEIWRIEHGFGADAAVGKGTGAERLRRQPVIGVDAYSLARDLRTGDECVEHRPGVELQGTKKLIGENVGHLKAALRIEANQPGRRDSDC